MEAIKKETNCWEYWKCDEGERKKCLVFLSNYGQRCYFLAASSPMKKRDFISCIDCPWYLKQSTL